MGAWVELRLRIPRARLQAVTARMLEEGAIGLQEDRVPGEAAVFRQPWDTGPAPPEPAELLLRGWWEADGFEERWPALEGRLAEVAGAAVERAEVQEEDWASAWRQAFARATLAPGLVVAPPWLAEPGDLIIEPGMAFGTGEHPTTRACLVELMQWARPGGRCLDVGTGSGIVAIAAERLGMRAWGIDIDPRALEDARENAQRNGVSPRLDETPLDRVEGRFDLVVANIFAEVLVRMAPDLARLCAGHLILAGILQDRSLPVELALRAQGLRPVRREVEGEWVSMVWAAGSA